MMRITYVGDKMICSDHRKPGPMKMVQVAYMAGCEACIRQEFEIALKRALGESDTGDVKQP